MLLCLCVFHYNTVCNGRILYDSASTRKLMVLSLEVNLSHHHLRVKAVLLLYFFFFISSVPHNSLVWIHSAVIDECLDVTKLKKKKGC